MKPCKKCQANDWDYKKIDNDPNIYCICKSCGFELSFKIPKKICSFCKKPADFERIDLGEKERGKKCSLCGKTKILKNASGIYKKIDGIMKLKIDGEFREVALMEVKKGWQILPID